MAKRTEPFFLFEFRKKKSKPKLQEMSFSGNKKNSIDEKLDKALIKPKRGRKK